MQGGFKQMERHRLFRGTSFLTLLRGHEKVERLHELVVNGTEKELRGIFGGRQGGRTLHWAIAARQICMAPRQRRARGKQTTRPSPGQALKATYRVFEDSLNALLARSLAIWGPPCAGLRRFWQYRETFLPGSTTRTGSGGGAHWSSRRPGWLGPRSRHA